MWSKVAAATIAVATAISVPAAAADPPPEKDRVGVDVLNVNGSGCRQGTAAASVSPDNRAFTITYSKYLAQVGVGATKADEHRDCRLKLKVRPPAGYAYTILRVDYRGYADLAAGAGANLRASYYFQGPKPAGRVHPLAGPLDSNWQVTDVAPTSALVYGPCGAARNLSVDTELTVSAGRSDVASTTSYLAMDSTDGAVQSTYHLGWKRCA